MPFLSPRVFLFCVIILHCACEKKVPTSHTVSFYYWQSKLHFSPTEAQILNDLNVKKLYIKFFDIKWDEVSHQIQPVAQIQADSAWGAERRELIPCVFIENRVFLHVDTAEIHSFAQIVAQKLHVQFALFVSSPIQQIQIDCDWNTTTRAAYFEFLRHLKAATGKEISCTIRLHQVKYLHKTGVPPVTKGVLMCYNLGSIQDVKENNSIFNLNLLKNYTQNITAYPLQLDIALPMYEWAVVFRNQRFAYVWTASDRIKKEAGLEQITDNRYVCHTSMRVGEKILLKGDLLRVESVSDAELEETIKWFDERLKNYTIVFYHLDDRNLVSHEGILRLFPTF